MLGHPRLFEYQRVPRLGLPLSRILEARASKKTWQAPTLQMGIQPENQGARNDTGESVFPETDSIPLFFRFAYIPFCYA